MCDLLNIRNYEFTTHQTSFMKKITFFVVLHLLFANLLFAQTTSQTYNSYGDYILNPPPGVTVFEVYVYGAGGGGNPYNGNGGGSGAFTYGSFTLKGNKVSYIHVGKGGTSAQSGESSIIYYLDSTGTKVPYVAAYGGSGITGAGGTAYVGSFYAIRGGNGSSLLNGYYGAGGGTPYLDIPDAPAATGSSCNTGGISYTGGNGGNGSGPGCTKTAGIAPGGGGGSGSGLGANGADGRVEIYWTCPNQLPIGISHTVPYPQEKNPDYIKDTGIALSPTGNGLIYSWQQNRDTTTGSSNNIWTAAPGSTNDLKYALPQDSLLNYYRRVSNICYATQYSNVVKINVVRKDTITPKSPLGSVGSIQGRILSKGGNPVKGDSVLVIKQIDLNGSLKTFSYYDTTNGSGSFTVKNLFYGKYSNQDGDPSTVRFYVLPIKYQHVFIKYTSDDTTNADLSSSLYDVKLAPGNSDYTFKDLTAVSVLGRTYQQCDACLLPNGNTGAVQRDLDSVTLTVNGQVTSLISQVNDDGFHGRFTYTLDDITNSYRFTPKYKNHKFDTTGNIIKTSRDTVLALRDTTTHAVSGRFRAGCGEVIGAATLLFTDIPQTPDRDAVFNKVITTQTNGNYTLRLPAGKYKVKMTAYTPPAGSGLQQTNVLNFFSGDSISTAINPDSLKVAIDTSDAVLNLTYQRPPTLQLIGWDSVCQTVYGQGFDVWKQLDAKKLQIKVFQGPSLKTCPLTTDSIKIYTTVQTDGIEERFTLKVDTAAASLGIVKDTLKVGVPNISGDYTKSLIITYADRYGNTTSLTKKIVVTGSRSRPGQTFETVSPSIPLLVLHDPPGDQSYSSWAQTKSTETAMRFSTNQAGGATIWAEAKVGASFTSGVGFGVLFATDFEAWASVNASATVTAKNATQNELIVHSEINTNIQTSADKNGVGPTGDVFYGGALNIVYGISDDVSYSNCVITKKESPVFAPNKIMTTYLYTAQDIANTIENLRVLAEQTPSRADSFNNQANVWQQVLDNNERNKANAKFIENRTFTGGGASQTITTSNSSTGTNTVEFGIEIDASLAIELGLEVAGSGIKGGVIVNLQMETGVSKSNASTTGTDISYFLQDENSGDKFTVNISKDPVYGTPVFKTLAGLSSCPPEEGTIARDEMTIKVNGPSELSNIPATAQASFELEIGNNSVDVNPKDYYLYLLNNPDGAVIIPSSLDNPAVGLLLPAIPKGGTTKRTFNIARNGGLNASYTYKDLQFVVTDKCSNPQAVTDANVSRTQLISVNFTSSCSGINLTSPETGWVVNKANNNILQVTFDGYTVNSLLSVIVQYRNINGSGTWNDATSTKKTAADLTGSISYIINWDIATLPEGKYDIRMKLVCATGIIYTKTAKGLIDRKAPALFGIPDPTDGNYAPGDVISFNYDEDIDISDLNNNKVFMYRMSNNYPIPVTVTGNGSKIIILPAVNLQTYLGDSIKVVVTNIADLYGNITASSDVSSFSVGTLPPTISPAKPAKVYATPASVYENSGTRMDVHVKMDVLPKRPIVKVNFTIGGTATLGKDFTLKMDTIYNVVKNPSTGVNELIPLVSSFNGVQGYIYIDSAKPDALIKITSIPDGTFEANEKIVISIIAGGDYNLADSLSATATILNDDLQPPLIEATGDLTTCTGGSAILTATTPNTITRYATSVIAKSNEYSPNEWGAKQTLGAPNVFPAYGDIQYAWSPTLADNPREYLELGFSNPAPVNFINIYETFNPGAIDTVYVKNPATTQWVRVYAENAMPAGDSSRVLNITFPVTGFAVSAIRIALNSAIVPGFNEIDAVGIGLDTTYTSYLWSTGATTKSINVNTTGVYTVTVKNGVDQSAVSESVSFSSSALAATTANTSNPLCFGATGGAIKVNAVGGINPYQYKFDSLAADAYKLSAVFKPLKAGAYQFTIRDSIGCIATTPVVTLTQPVAVAGTFTKTNATCIGKADGTITVTMTGGAAPYAYKVGLGGVYQDSKILIGIKAGTYTVYVKDANGCVGAIGPVVIGQTNVACLSFAATSNANEAAKENGMALVLTPNPSHSDFTLRVISTSKEPVSIKVSDELGRYIKTVKWQPNEPLVFGKELLPGMYLVEATQAKAKQTVKAIKLR